MKLKLNLWNPLSFSALVNFVKSQAGDWRLRATGLAFSRDCMDLLEVWNGSCNKDEIIGPNATTYQPPSNQLRGGWRAGISARDRPTDHLCDQKKPLDIRRPLWGRAIERTDKQHNVGRPIASRPPAFYTAISRGPPHEAERRRKRVGPGE